MTSERFPPSWAALALVWERRAKASCSSLIELSIGYVEWLKFVVFILAGMDVQSVLKGYKLFTDTALKNAIIGHFE